MVKAVTTTPPRPLRLLRPVDEAIEAMARIIASAAVKRLQERRAVKK